MKLFALLPALLCILRAEEIPGFDYRSATVVVYNSKDPSSTELAKYYAEKRGIPEENLVGLKCTPGDPISRQQFQNEIENPLRAEFDARKWWETARVPKEGLLAVKTTMRVLVLIQGVPMRIAEVPPGKDPKTGQPIVVQPGGQNAAAVDSELAALGVIEKPIAGLMPNPYHKSTAEFSTVALTPMFLVGRLDGPNKAIVKQMMDDALAVEKEGLYGRAFVDLARKTDAGYAQGENWLINSARQLQSKGLPVVLDTWAPTLPLNFPMHDCAFYLGWYTDHADGPFLNPAFRFQKGAVAVHIHSFSAANLHSDKYNWCGPILARGACATLGNVFEPYLSATANLDIFTDRLLRGFTLGEAAWMSTPILSWMNVVLGDPLYRPFGVQPGDGDKQFSPEFKAIRLAMQRWGEPRQAEELEANLTRAAASFKSVSILEFLALHAQSGEGKSWPKAEKWFLEAEKLATGPRDRMRLQFLMADALRRDGEVKKATKILNTLIDQNPGAPEAAAAKAWIGQMK